MADSAATAPPFFTVGGTLRVQDQSYVPRPADHVLEENLRAGMFCTVLTARQMGKSSLMVRTARRLADQGTRCAVVDLTAIGTKVAADGWYLGVLAPIRNQLRLAVDLAAWWAEHSAMGASERFATFLCDVALAQADTPLVIFVDEIDTTLALDTQLRDDFFIAIRAIANERANTPNSPFTRLTFAFFGVATPDDLVGDRRRTAFNIGAQIELDDLSLKDAAPLLAGLDRAHPEDSMSVLWQIFAWTGGHPYLTQKLCAAAARASFDAKDERALNQLVRAEVLDEGANDDNLAFIRNRISSVSSDEQRSLLVLYRRVLRGEGVADDETSIVQNRLELTGLIKVVGGRLVVRNPIYRTAFDDAWVRAVMPRNHRQRLAIASIITAVLVVLAVGLGLLWLNPTDEDARAQALDDGFMTTVAKTPSADMPIDDRQRLDSLDQLLQLQHDQAAYREQALRLFYDHLNFDQQQKLFIYGIYGDTGDGSKLLRVATAIAATLGPEDDGSDMTIINEIISGLGNVQGNSANIEALQGWVKLRQELRNNNTIAAQQLVNLSPLPANSTILGTAPLLAPTYAFDIARTWANANPPDERALAALQAMLDAATIQPTPLPTTPTRGSTNAAILTIQPGILPTTVPVATQQLTSEPLQPASPLPGGGLHQTQRFRNRKQIEQTIQQFIRAHPAVEQALRLRQSQYAQLANLVEIKSSSDTAYIVQPGDTLPRIALVAYGNANAWPTIFNANADRIANPGELVAGTVLVIPDAVFSNGIESSETQTALALAPSTTGTVAASALATSETQTALALEGAVGATQTVIALKQDAAAIQTSAAQTAFALEQDAAATQTASAIAEIFAATQTVLSLPQTAVVAIGTPFPASLRRSFNASVQVTFPSQPESGLLRSCVDAQVLDQRGRGIAGAIVQLNNGVSFSEPKSTNASGAVEFCNLGASKWSVVLQYVPQPLIDRAVVAVIEVSGQEGQFARVVFSER